ncbi:hypothetical protein [Thiorhodococcus fuscus]|uniref:Antitermination protein NusG n=1 Tax=Thiorhodococcus fuscus TaxID=527200 RepID=A0ABW4YBK7_9GAMM
MFWKLLLTLGVIAAVYGSLRSRRRAELIAHGQEVGPPLVPPGLMRRVAWGLIAVMLLGSAVYLVQDWLHDHQRVEVQVVNANTGAIARYQAHRGDIQGRRLTTLDGREIRLADVERMIILPASSGD